MERKEQKPVNEQTEQYVKDVRKVDSDENEMQNDSIAVKESQENDEIQEGNKKSQRNAEKESKYGDCSDTDKSKFRDR